MSVQRPRALRLPIPVFHPYAGRSIALGSFRAVQRACKPGRTILHAHAITPDGLAGVHIARRLRIPLVCTALGSDLNVYPWRSDGMLEATKAALRGASAVVTVSDALKRKVNELEATSAPVSTIYMGVDTNLFQPTHDRTPARDRWGIPRDAQVIAFIGRLEAAKGFKELAEAFGALAVRHPRLFLVLIGTEPDGVTTSVVTSATLQWTRAGVVDRVLFAGRRLESEVAEILTAADLFALPSHTEGVPNAVVEAMATGLPVVSTRIGGVPEAVDEGCEGFLIPARNSLALVSRIEQLVTDPFLRRQMGAAGRRRAMKQFRWADHAARHEELYEAISERHQHGNQDNESK